MSKLDRTEQRVVGVLIEKQLTVPDSYPLSENSLVAGCNQSSNRDPVMEVVSFQVTGVLMALQEKGWVTKVDGGGRVPRYRHRVDEELHVDHKATAVLAELLVRGPQAPGALKPRVARMGFHGSPEDIEAVLRDLAGRRPAIVEQLPQRPRERDRRWRHLLGDGSEAVATTDDAVSVGASPRAAAEVSREVPVQVPVQVPIAEWEARIEALERSVGELRQIVNAMRTMPTGD